MTIRFLQGDALTVLRTLPAESATAAPEERAADRPQRHAIGIDLHPQYNEMASERVMGDAPLLAEIRA